MNIYIYMNRVEYMQYREMPSDIKRKVALRVFRKGGPPFERSSGPLARQPERTRTRACARGARGVPAREANAARAGSDAGKFGRGWSGARPAGRPCPRRQVRSYFTLCWRRSPAPFDEMRVLRDIHGPLRALLLRHVGALVRADIPILQV